MVQAFIAFIAVKYQFQQPTVFITLIPGLISTLMPRLIEILADLWDIRRGMMAIIALIVLLLAVTIVDLRQKRFDKGQNSG